MKDAIGHLSKSPMRIPLGRLVMIVALTTVSGAANAVTIFVVTAALRYPLHASVFIYFAISSLTYLAARKSSETQLLRITSKIVHNTRIGIVSHILTLPYPDFESTERSVFYNVISEDINTVGNASSIIVTLATSVVTIVAACCYMYVIDPTVALIMTSLVGVISVVYVVRTQQARRFLDAARRELNNYVEYVNELLDGFKELRIDAAKMAAFRGEMEASAASCRRSSDYARIRLFNAFLTGETLLLAALACIAFLLPALMPERRPDTPMSFVIILLYLIGPIKAVLTELPRLVQLQMAWERIEHFLQSSPRHVSPTTRRDRGNVVAKLEICGVQFEYPSTDGQRFALGPVSFTASQGECIFVIGGNGTGKTTLAKLVLGLYEPTDGEIRIDGKAIDSATRGEYFSVVFSPCHVFRKFFGINDAPHLGLRKEARRLGLSDKIGLRDDGIRASTLSAGQRKRVALLGSLLQDRPILLFDEFAADQDPEFRRFFYAELLADLKCAGKIIIAITHDEQYFCYADQILKLELDRAVSPHPSPNAATAKVESLT